MTRSRLTLPALGVFACAGVVAYFAGWYPVAASSARPGPPRMQQAAPADPLTTTRAGSAYRRAAPTHWKECVTRN